METIFWAPVRIVDDYNFYFTCGIIGFLTSLALLVATIVAQVSRRKFHALFVLAILGLGAPLVFEMIGMDPLTPVMHVYSVSFTMLGLIVLFYGLVSHRAQGWMPLFFLPAICGVSYWSV